MGWQDEAREKKMGRGKMVVSHMWETHVSWRIFLNGIRLIPGGGMRDDDGFPRVLRLPLRGEREGFALLRPLYICSTLFQVDYQSLMLLSERTPGAGDAKEISTLIESTSELPFRVTLVTSSSDCLA